LVAEGTVKLSVLLRGTRTPSPEKPPNIERLIRCSYCEFQEFLEEKAIKVAESAKSEPCDENFSYLAKDQNYSIKISQSKKACTVLQWKIFESEVLYFKVALCFQL
jgi:hypothetical protein